MNLLFALLFLVGCQPSEPTNDHEALVKQGRSTYQTACISCHSFDPAGDGPVGPAVIGASKELLEEKILRGAYPPGYTPKRDTKIMAPMPQLQKDIPALEAYLNSHSDKNSQNDR